jgi:hypothetical protein
VGADAATPSPPPFIPDTEDDKWETWGIAARWDTERGWHSPTDEW